MKTPAGCTVEAAFATVLAGRCMAQTLPELVEAASPVTMACVVPPFDLAPYLGARELQQVDRNAFLGVAAAVDAVTDATAGAAGGVAGTAGV
nr:3-oxoacyl-ACP synthase [Micromonospora sp. DSM 115978]